MKGSDRCLFQGINTLHEGTEKDGELLNQNNRLLNRESNPRPPEYERAILINKLWHSAAGPIRITIKFAQHSAYFILIQNFIVIH